MSRPSFSIVETPRGELFIWTTGRLSFHSTSSTSINQWSWADDTLTVKYNGTTDKVYHYHKVPYSVAIALLDAKSMGSYIAKEVKPNYEFTFTEYL